MEQMQIIELERPAKRRCCTLPRRLVLGATIASSSILFLASVVELFLHLAVIILLDNFLHVPDRDSVLISHDKLLFADTVICGFISSLIFFMAVHSANSWPYKIGFHFRLLFQVIVLGLLVLTTITMAYSFGDFDGSRSLSDAGTYIDTQDGDYNVEPAKPISRELWICALATVPDSAGWAKASCVGDRATRWTTLPMFFCTAMLALLFALDAQGGQQLMATRNSERERAVDGKMIDEEGAEPSYF